MICGPPLNFENLSALSWKRQTYPQTFKFSSKNKQHCYGTVLNSSLATLHSETLLEPCTEHSVVLHGLTTVPYLISFVAMGLQFTTVGLGTLFVAKTKSQARQCT